MKIRLDNAPAWPAGSYFQHLTKVLERHAPEHEYMVGGKRYNGVDLYHGFRPGLPFAVRLLRVKSVVTVPNLNFLRYPHLYSLSERLWGLALQRRALRAAGRLITFSSPAREELSERLKIDPRRIEVVMPLAARVPDTPPAGGELAAVGRKYSLPKRFVLMLGTVEPRHNHETLLEALLMAERAGRTGRGSAAGDGSGTAAAEGPEVAVVADGSGVAETSKIARDATAGSGAAAATGASGAGTAEYASAAAREPIGVVICGRRTAYSDFLLNYARRRHLAARVEFIYELAPRDLPALFRLAHAFVYLPDAAAEASIVPVVEALRAGLPMLLSDTPVNREAAADAALYADPECVEAVAEALPPLLRDETLRRTMREREVRRAELFSEYAVAERLMQIYTSL